MAVAFYSNASPREQLGKLIEDVANSGVKQLKQSDLKEFKRLCKKGDADLIDFVYRMFVMQLEKNHCQKRYSTMLLVEQLFPRSHRFRTVFTEQANLNKFFELTLGTDREKPLPKPKVYARLLSEKVNLLVKEWIREFGKGYPYLEQVYKMSLSQRLNETNDETSNPTPSRLDEETRREIRLMERIERKLTEYSTLKDELPEVLVQVKTCFELIIPKDEFSLDQINRTKDKEIDNEMSRFRSTTKSTQQQVSITLKPYLEVKVNENNRNTIEALRDLYKQLVNNYLPKIKNLLKNLSKAGVRCEKEVKQLIKCKGEVLELVSMYTELKFVDESKEEDNEDLVLIKNGNEEELNDENELSSSTDDDDFEEVEEKNVEDVPPERWSEYGIKNPFVDHYSNDNDPNRPSTSGLNSLTNYDPDACNVKMLNGNLCQRKDKERCPFHGKIVPRDSDGNALDLEIRKEEEEERSRRENDWQDPTYLKELENQIGIDLTIKKTKVKKNPELLNLKTCDETPKTRLMKRIKTLKKYSI